MPRMSDLGYLYSVRYERKERVLEKTERGEVEEERRIYFVLFYLFTNKIGLQLLYNVVL